MSEFRRHDPEEELPEPAPVRRLRLMVSALILVLIAGVVTVAATLVIRLGAIGPSQPPAIEAEAIALPAGEEMIAIGRGAGEILVGTRDGTGVERLRAFDAATGEARSVTRVERE